MAIYPCLKLHAISSSRHFVRSCCKVVCEILNSDINSFRSVFETASQSYVGSMTTCAVKLILSLLIAHTCNSCISNTPSVLHRDPFSLFRSISFGTPSSNILMLSFSKTNVRGKTHRPIRTAITESTDFHPVK